jgi:hypothetical protein
MLTQRVISQVQCLKSSSAAFLQKQTKEKRRQPVNQNTALRPFVGEIVNN